MPNQNSNAGHIPQRTCVVCRKICAQSELLSFFLLPSGLVIDLKNRLQARKQYLCANPGCYAGLAKWRRKYAKKIGLR
ncbi:MAG TPA: DUF448 domain-containing protein [Candidatus Cloacimonadota bacterium]|nr:DUF448 domain-containing protein [Candidatus Cloacimonadota bacterium]